MSLFLEYGYTSFNKKGEELCGDMVSVVRKDGYTKHHGIRKHTS